MNPIRFKLLVLTLLAALALGGAAYAASFSAAKADDAYAEASRAPGTSVADLALGLRQNATETVDERNGAIAYSSGDGCRSVALAFQVVVVQGSPSTVTPKNVALALDEGCSRCTSLALAYQFVAGRGEPARLTEDGREDLGDVARDLLALERSYARLTDDEIRARAERNAAEVRRILDTELVPVRRGGDDPDVDESRRVSPTARGGAGWRPV